MTKSFFEQTQIWLLMYLRVFYFFSGRWHQYLYINLKINSDQCDFCDGILKKNFNCPDKLYSLAKYVFRGIEYQRLDMSTKVIKIWIIIEFGDFILTFLSSVDNWGNLILQMLWYIIKMVMEGIKFYLKQHNIGVVFH